MKWKTLSINLNLQLLKSKTDFLNNLKMQNRVIKRRKQILSKDTKHLCKKKLLKNTKTHKTSKRWKWTILKELKNFKHFTTKRSLLKTLTICVWNKKRLKWTKCTSKSSEKWRKTTKRTFKNLKRSIRSI